ncbi:hypothetical protein CDL12_01694 [Handroanthus impetiginosus]|uniref:Uncharacterized protein n=1 Tax=Handroanthus impetiginosus TaxID=429701 RepID=A0A2G9I730_9LAMI|nr:hypothetical protein CDL12_01694 [Handroanthus impetiginosus]
MGHCCTLISCLRDEEVCRDRRKSEEILRRLHLHNAENRLKSITIKMVFEFNPTSQELCLLNSDSTVAIILNKRVAKLEAATNKDLCVLAPVKADTDATKEQGDHGTTCEEHGDNDGEEKERKDKEEENQEDKEMDKERKNEKDKIEEKKTEEGQDDKKGEKGKEKEDDKEEEMKYGDNDEEHDHDANNEYNEMNEENQTKPVEMYKKLEVISRKLDFGQDMDFGEWDYEVVRTLSSIIDDFDSPLSTMLAKCAKQRNEKRDHAQGKKTIPEQEKAGPQQKKLLDLKLR